MYDESITFSIIMDTLDSLTDIGIILSLLFGFGTIEQI